MDRYQSTSPGVGDPCLKESSFRSIQRINRKTGMCFTTKFWPQGPQLLHLRTFVFSLGTAGIPGLPTVLSELLRWTVESPSLGVLCTDLRRVALFSVAIHSLYLLHVQHLGIRSCEPSATQKMLVRLIAHETKNEKKESFPKHYI